MRAGGPNQDRRNQAEFGGLDGAFQRDLIAGMRDRGLGRRQLPRRLDRHSYFSCRGPPALRFARQASVTAFLLPRALGSARHGRRALRRQRPTTLVRSPHQPALRCRTRPTGPMAPEDRFDLGQPPRAFLRHGAGRRQHATDIGQRLTPDGSDQPATTPAAPAPRDPDPLSAAGTDRGTSPSAAGWLSRRPAGRASRIAFAAAKPRSSMLCSGRRM